MFRWGQQSTRHAGLGTNPGQSFSQTKISKKSKIWDLTKALVSASHTHIFPRELTLWVYKAGPDYVIRRQKRIGFAKVCWGDDPGGDSECPDSLGKSHVPCPV
jgi:hypothetical protein